MQKKYRRIIFIIFFLLFAASIPLVFIYTAGYRYNIKKGGLEKTGAILVGLKTKNAVLYLNERAHQVKETLRIRNLLPDDYSIRISKSGYHDWQKKLTVESELTTFIKDLRLLKKNLPVKFFDLPIETFYPSEDKSKLVYARYDRTAAAYRLSVLDIDGKKTRKITKLPQLPLAIEWSPDNNKFFIGTNAGFRIFDLKNGEIYLPFFKNKIYELRWDKKSGFGLFARTGDGIYRIDLLLKNYSKIYSSKTVDDFYYEQGILYSIERGSLKQVGVSDKQTVFAPLERKDYKIKNIAGGRIFLLSPAGKLQIFALPITKSSAPLLLANAVDYNISGDYLLYYNDFEIWNCDLSSGSKELITRVGANIKKAFWANDVDYIVFVGDNKIQAMETDKRDKRQTFTLASMEDIGEIMLAKRGILYFSGRLNKISELYKLEL